MRHTAIAIAILVTTSGLPMAGEQARRDVWKRVAFTVLEDYDKGEDLDEVARDFALMRELEIDTWRGSLGWDDFEPAPGKYDFSWLERFVDLARRHRITLRPYVGYTPEWAAAGGADGQAWNDPPRSLDAWRRFVEQLTMRVRRQHHVASIEIYNEQNVPQWWDGTIERYAAVLQHGITAVDRRRPGWPLLPGGLVFPDEEWIDRVCRTGVGRRLAALAIHAYPETWTPPGVITAESYLGEGFEAFLRTADETCGRKPIWINEAGFATTPGKSERDQANWWVRATASFFAHPRVEQIGVYEIKDLAPDRPVIGDTPNYHLGLTYPDRRKKLAFSTIDLLTDLLDTGRIQIADDDLIVHGAAEEITVYRHLFVRPDRHQVAFVWTSGGTATVSLRLQRPASLVTEYQLDGSREPPRTVQDQTLTRIAIGSEPRIFVFQ